MPNILVVDDSATMRRMVMASLRTLTDVRFVEAGNGLEALEQLALAPVDLITLDLNMPDMHGIEVVQFVRGHQRYQSLPIIVLTTRGDATSRSIALAAGASEYVTKPFTPATPGYTRAHIAPAILVKEQANIAFSPPAVDSSFDVFLDDFFAECDEHLTLVRRSLLALEPFVGQAQVDRALLDDLFRAFHSLKGLAGMVGVSEVEQLAHQMESVLRALQQQQVRLRSETLDALIAGARLLEQAVAARRTAAAPPAIAATLAQLEDLIAHEESVPPMPSALVQAAHALKPEERTRLDAAHAQGQRIWRITFTPAPQLAERGMNVNAVRGRLQVLGEVIRAVPQVLVEGSIAFSFLLASNVDEAAFAGWQDDGLSVLPYDEPAPLAAPPTPDSPLLLTSSDTPSVAGASSAASANVVRVELARLDHLMHLVSELVVTRARLEAHMARVERTLPVAEWRGLQEINLVFERQLRALRYGVLRTRMVDIGDAFARMQFVVRDLARDLKKQVMIELSGQETEIDKFVAERMLDPLLHLVRNAVSHGLEPPEERLAHGKPPAGTLALRATTAGDMITLLIADDGRGIDTQRVMAQARAQGLIADDAPLDDAQLLQLLCTPGFSTRAQADRLSGRGVGMDVVATTVRKLGGTLALATTAGRGSCFTIQLPLTLAIMDALIVGVADQCFAVPLQLVREVIEVDSAQLVTLERNELLPHRGSALPLVRLARRFGLAELPHAGERAFVVGSGRMATAIVVDQLLGKREIVVRPLTDPLMQVAGIAGATELGDGQVVLILDVAALVEGGS